MARFNRNDPERIARMNRLCEMVRNDTTEYSDEDDENEIDEKFMLYFFKYHDTMEFNPPTIMYSCAKRYKQMLVDKNMWTDELEKTYEIMMLGHENDET